MDDREQVESEAREPARVAQPEPAHLHPTAASALALQRTAGNRAVAALARTMQAQKVQRWVDELGDRHEGGNLLDGMFAAFIPGVGTTTVRVVPWNSRDGTNNNYLDIRGFQKNSMYFPPILSSNSAGPDESVSGLDVSAV
jgi:hypothetical protein